MNQQEMIDEIMDFFDFDKVHKVMTMLDWKWALNNGLEIPDKSIIRKHARRLLKEVLINKKNEEYYYISSGGFKATWQYDELNLEFILETC